MQRYVTTTHRSASSEGLVLEGTYSAVLEVMVPLLQLLLRINNKQCRLFKFFLVLIVLLENKQIYHNQLPRARSRWVCGWVWGWVWNWVRSWVWKIL